MITRLYNFLLLIGVGILCICSFNNVTYAQCRAEVSSISAPISGCGPLTVIFNSDSSNGTITTYSWDFGDGSPTVSTANPTHTYASVTSDTLYLISLSITCSTAPNVHDTLVGISVYAPPNVSFSIDTSAVCNFSDTVCFSNQSETGVGFTYNWDFGDLNTCTPSCYEPCHSYATDGSYTVQLIVTDDNFCQDSTSLVVNTNFSLLPTATLNSSASNDTICIGDSITFTVSPGGYLIQPVIYQFYKDSVNIQSGPGNTYTTDLLADGDTIFAIVINASGCVGDTSNTLVTTVLPLPGVSLTSSDSVLCEGDSLSFTAASFGLSSYFFYNGTSLLQNSSSNTYVTDSLLSGNNVYALGVSIEGCVSPPSNTLSVIIKPTPSPYISTDTTSLGLCIGESAILSVVDTSVSGVNFVWSTADTTNSITISPSTTSIYYVTGSLNGCFGTDTITIFVDTVLPTADAGFDTVLCDGESVTLSASGGTFYTWTPATDLSCTDCQSPLATPVATMTYQVTVTNIVCFDTDAILVTMEPCTVGSIPQIITPNSDGDNDFLEIVNIQNFPENKLEIINRWGNLVFSTEAYDNTGNFWEGKSNKGVDLPDGTYYYVLDLKDGSDPLTGFIMLLR